MDARHYTPLEVAQMIGVDRETVLRFVRSGQLAAVRLGHRTVRIGASDLEAFLNARRAR